MPATVSSVKTRKRIDYSLGENICEWIERECRIPDGRLVGQQIELLPEQREFIRQAFRKVGGKRQVKRAVLSVARKFGKSCLIAAILLAFLCGPLAAPQQNRQAYSAALTRHVASAVQARSNAVLVLISIPPHLEQPPELAAGTKPIPS